MPNNSISSKISCQSYFITTTTITRISGALIVFKQHAGVVAKINAYVVEACLYKRCNKEVIHVEIIKIFGGFVVVEFYLGMGSYPIPGNYPGAYAKTFIGIFCFGLVTEGKGNAYIIYHYLTFVGVVSGVQRCIKYRLIRQQSNIAVGKTVIQNIILKSGPQSPFTGKGFNTPLVIKAYVYGIVVF